MIDRHRMHLPVWIFSYRPVLSSICLYRMVNVTWYPFTSIVLPVPYPFTGMVYPVTARRSRHFFSTGIYFITSTVSICRYGIILPILYPVTGMVFRCRPVFSSITFCCLLMLPGIHLAVVYLLLFRENGRTSWRIPVGRIDGLLGSSIGVHRGCVRSARWGDVPHEHGMIMMILVLLHALPLRLACC